MIKKIRFAILLLALATAAALAPSASATPTSITSNFNGTNIDDDSFIWFSSHLTAVSDSSTPFSVFFQNQTISLTSEQTGISYSLAVPDAVVTFDPSAGTTSTNFTSHGFWETIVPSDSNDPFLSGLAWDVPYGENPKASNPVIWSGDFFASEPGVSISWQFGAAVYEHFSTDLDSLGVTPIDGFDSFSQSGTPANFAHFVTGGARGGGGSNFTGSNSATVSVRHLDVIPEPGTGLLVLAAGGLAIFRRRR